MRTQEGTWSVIHLEQLMAVIGLDNIGALLIRRQFRNGPKTDFQHSPIDLESIVSAQNVD